MGRSLLGQPGIVFVGYCWMSVNPTAVTHEATNCHISLEYYSVELSFLSAVLSMQVEILCRELQHVKKH